MLTLALQCLYIVLHFLDFVLLRLLYRRVDNNQCVLKHVLTLPPFFSYFHLCRIRQKPKLEVALVKGPDFEVVMEQEEKEAAERAAKRAAAEAAAANGKETE